MQVLHRLWTRIGFRGSALLFFAVLDLVYAFSLFFPPPGPQQTASMRWVADVAPLPVWAALWGVVGVICLAFAVRHYDKVAFSAAIAIKILWGVMHLLAWLLGDVQRAYVSATIWLCVAGFVAIISAWPEPEHPIRSRHAEE